MIDINLPPLPPLPAEVIVDEDCTGNAVYGQDEDALRAWATSYAELAVRDAIVIASQLCRGNYLLRQAEGFPREASMARSLAEKILALIPESSHE